MRQLEIFAYVSNRVFIFSRVKKKKVLRSRLKSMGALGSGSDEDIHEYRYEKQLGVH